MKAGVESKQVRPDLRAACVFLFSFSSLFLVAATSRHLWGPCAQTVLVAMQNPGTMFGGGE
jgi:hypothetical protein